MVKPLDPFPQCVDCLLGLASQVPVLTGRRDPAGQKQVLETAKRLLEKKRDSGLSSPELAYLIFEAIRDVFPMEDPFRDFKRKEMAGAREVFARLEEAPPSDLRACVSLAAVGNSLDFFQDPVKVLAEIPEVVSRGLDFQRDEISRLDALLDTGVKRVVYLTDNAGEVYFDRPLFAHLRGRAARTVLVVKGGPSLNDLTRAELLEDGLADFFGDIDDTGTAGAGVNWRGVSEGFLDRLAGADLILSKGMANFETLFPSSYSAKTFFLFRVKCRPIQEYIGAPLGSHVAMFGSD